MEWKKHFQPTVSKTVWGNLLTHFFQNIGANVTTRRQTQQKKLELNNGHRDNLTSCFTLHMFLLMPYDWFDTNRVSDGKLFRSTIME